MRTPIMAGNWKMNNTWAQSVVLAQAISNNAKHRWETDVEVVLFPATCNIKAVKSVLEFDNAPIALGAQNVHWEPSGAFTGDVSIPMLEEIGATYCIVGHSERREYSYETDEMVNKKVHALIASGMTPIACVGESVAVREAASYIDFVCSQVDAALAGLEPELAAKCVLAYEPLWAIGTGRTATPEQAQEVCAAIRQTVRMRFGEAADEARVLYGGSVNVGNVESLIDKDDIDGCLVGGASLVANDFVALVEACLNS